MRQQGQEAGQPNKLPLCVPDLSQLVHVWFNERLKDNRLGPSLRNELLEEIVANYILKAVKFVQRNGSFGDENGMLPAFSAGNNFDARRWKAGIDRHMFFRFFLFFSLLLFASLL